MRWNQTNKKLRRIVGRWGGEITSPILQKCENIFTHQIFLFSTHVKERQKSWLKGTQLPWSLWDCILDYWGKCMIGQVIWFEVEFAIIKRHYSSFYTADELWWFVKCALVSVFTSSQVLYVFAKNWNSLLFSNNCVIGNRKDRLWIVIPKTDNQNNLYVKRQYNHQKWFSLSPSQPSVIFNTFQILGFFCFKKICTRYKEIYNTGEGARCVF